VNLFDFGNTNSETLQLIFQTNKWAFDGPSAGLSIDLNGVVSFSSKSNRMQFAHIIIPAESPRHLRLLLCPENTGLSYSTNRSGYVAYLEKSSPDTVKFNEALISLFKAIQYPERFRIIASYPPGLTKTQINLAGITEFQLGFAEQVRKSSERAGENAKEVIRQLEAVDRTEALWLKLRSSEKLHFPKEADYQSLAAYLDKEGSRRWDAIFWQQIDRLCTVALYKRPDDSKQFSKRPSPAESLKRDAELKKDEMGEMYQRIIELANDWQLLEGFVSLSSRKELQTENYSGFQSRLKAEALSSGHSVATLEPTRLKLDLQMLVWGGNWLNLFQIDCHQPSL